ncbi:MAG: bifunctional hydroxymethylpyrimidine kinase/phosphomethylpyrimidine kinase [Sulfurovum sp.]
MKCILSIAGSDSCGGAGIQADIKSAHYHGVYACTAITAVTAQNTLGVQGIVNLEPSFVVEQINSVLNDFKVDVIKIGMLSNYKIIDAVYETLKNTTIPIILDPVAVSRSGFKLIDDDAVDSLKKLFKIAYIITPNYYETKLFFGIEKYDQIKTLENIYENILFKNLSQESMSSNDLLLNRNGEITEYKSAKVDSSNTHGTGCSFSSSLASLIALGSSLDEAIKVSKKFIHNGIEKSPNFGKGNGPINHILN